MKYSKISFENIGPIQKGQIEHNKINLFFGPNNSGKSIASRIIYGIGQLDTSKPSKFQKMINHRLKSKRKINDFYGQIILSNAGIHYRDVATHNSKKSTLTINSNKKSTKINFQSKHSVNFLDHFPSSYLSKYYQTSKDSVYIPAGRTGTIQFFTNIIQVRNKLFRDVLQTFRDNDFSDSKQSTKKEIKNFTHSSSKMPEHLEQFQDLILETHTEGLNQEAQSFFSDLFPGSIDITRETGFDEITYKDPTGFITKIESAGSAAVSSFPIIAGVYYVKKGGTLIIEEPEAQLEPARQLKLIEKLVSIADTKKIDLVFTTHSDYVIKKLLALVSRKKIKHTDLGIYYFNRVPESLTRIEKIDVDKTGEAKQTLFDDAINTLVEEFTK